MKFDQIKFLYFIIALILIAYLIIFLLDPVISNHNLTFIPVPIFPIIAAIINIKRMKKRKEANSNRSFKTQRKLKRNK